MESGSDRRAAPRAAIEDVPAEIWVGGHDLGLHTISDASSCGVFVRHDAPVLPVATVIELVFVSPSGRAPLRLTGTVVRVVRSGSPGYGVALHDAPADVVQRIQALRAPRAPLEAAASARAPRTEGLVIENQLPVGVDLVRLLAVAGVRATLETTVTRALEHLAAHPGVGLVLMDHLLPDVPGEGAIARFVRPQLKIIALTGVLHTVAAQRPLLQAGADRVLHKPIDPFELGIVLRALLDPTRS